MARINGLVVYPEVAQVVARFNYLEVGSCKKLVATVVVMGLPLKNDSSPDNSKPGVSKEGKLIVPRRPSHGTAKSVVCEDPPLWAWYSQTNPEERKGSLIAPLPAPNTPTSFHLDSSFHEAIRQRLFNSRFGLLLSNYGFVCATRMFSLHFLYSIFMPRRYCTVCSILFISIGLNFHICTRLYIFIQLGYIK